MEINIDDLLKVINNLSDTHDFKDYHGSYNVVFLLCQNKENQLISSLYSTGLQKIKQEPDINKKEKMSQVLNNVFAYAMSVRII